MKKRWLFALPLLLMASRFPPGSNTVDPLNYGAVPNDGLPDTAAIQAAARAAIWYGHIMEFTGPPGTEYLIDAPIVSQILHSGVYKWVNNWIIQCDPGVVIRLANNSPAFQTPSAPHAMFEYASTTNNAPTPTTASGGGNEGYRNTFDGACELNTGSGNPGAAGIRWVVSNRGALRDVTIKSGDGFGVAGVLMGTWPGPGLIEGVTIDGFDYGTLDTWGQYGITYRDVTLLNQRVAGIKADNSMTSIEGLHSCNTVPAVRVNGNAGQLLLIDSQLDCGTSAQGAIQIGTGTYVTLRDVTSSGYGALVRKGTVFLTALGSSVTEWLAHSGFSLFDTEIASLRLPVELPPAEFTSSNAADWADPRSYGANPNTTADTRPGILAAIATGKPILQLVQGHAGGSSSSLLSRYFISDTIDIPCSVKRIEGMESKLQVSSAFPLGHPTLRMADPTCTASDVTVVERIWGSGKSAPFLEVSDARTVYVRDVQATSGSTGIAMLAGSGKLFLRDISALGMRIARGSSVWAWQLNPESFVATPEGMVNEGTLRVLAMKTEGLSTGGYPTLTARAGSRTEILGGMIMPCVGAPDPIIGFVLEDADFSASYMNWGSKSLDDATWDVQVRETRVGETRKLLVGDVPTAVYETGNRAIVELYSAHGARAPQPESVLVVGNPDALTAADLLLQNQLELRGPVTLLDDAANSDVDGKDLVVIAPSVGVSSIGTKYRDITQPVIISKGFALAQMGMSQSGPAGYVSGKTSITITNATSPLAACLPAGDVTVYSSAARVQHGRAAATGTNVAKPQDVTASLYGILGYESGVTMEAGVVANGRRVGWLLGDDATSLTEQGSALLDAAIEWALGEAPSCAP